MRIRTVGAIMGLTCASTVLMAQATSPGSPSLWKSVQGVVKSKLLLPGSRRFQPGSRNADYYTIDGVNTTVFRYVRKQRSVVHCSHFPVGSVLIKENYNKQHKLVNITAMMKSPGYDAADHNWVMANYSPSGKVIAFGKIQACIDCHAIAAKTDFVFAPPPANLLSASTIHAFFPGKRITAPYQRLLKQNARSVLR